MMESRCITCGRPIAQLNVGSLAPMCTWFHLSRYPETFPKHEPQPDDTPDNKSRAAGETNE